MRASLKVKNQEKIFEKFKGEIRSNLYEEIIDITMQIKEIIRLSIFEIIIGCFMETWLLLHRKNNFFKVVVMFCTEYE